MPRVPTTQPHLTAPASVEAPPDALLLMAAADMHANDRLVTPPLEELSNTSAADIKAGRISPRAKDLLDGDDGLPFPYKDDEDNEKWSTKFGDTRAVKELETEINRLDEMEKRGERTVGTDRMKQYREKILKRQGS